MSRSVQKQHARPHSRFSRKEIEQYFFPKPISTALIIVTTAAALFSLVGLYLAFARGPSYFNLILVLLGGAVLFIGVRNIRAIMRSNPSDQDYDNWLEDQAATITPKALRTLSLSEHEITSQILMVRSIILPGSSLADNYRDDIHLKRGKDGQWRSSVNLYTFFFPADRFIAMFTRSINPLDRVMPIDDSSEEYFYRDIMSTSFNVFQDTVIFGDQEVLYRVQQLSLRIVNGSDVPIGGYLSAVPIEKGRGAPIIMLPDTYINQTLADLRALLRVKKQRGR
jgi:hypothetical protein